MTEKPDKDVPEELQQAKKSKELAAQKAQDELDKLIPPGERMLVALGYISFLCILPLVLLRESKFAQYHGRQALVLAVFIYFLDFIQIFPATIASVYTIVKTVVVIYSIYWSFKGQYFKIPVVYPMSERIQINIKSAHEAA
ncbi:MAG: hypothetical protein Q8P95_05570 [bacterium]|nr:hypothetical protein [bacterium]